MNEPANFEHGRIAPTECANNRLNYPPYKPSKFRYIKYMNDLMMLHSN